MTEKEALLWVLGILGSLCAAAITIDKVLEIIHKYIKKAQEPDNAQNKRLDELDTRVGTLEQGQLQHTQALARDLRRFDGLDEEMRLVLVGVQNLLDSQLSGNNREGMQKSKSDINNYLLKGVTNHGSNGITPACAGKSLKRSRSTVPPVAIVPLFPSVCNKPVVSDGSPAGRDAPLFLPAENAVPASPAYNLRSL